MIYRRRHSEWFTDDLSATETMVHAAHVAGMLMEHCGRVGGRAKAITAASMAKKLRAEGLDTSTARVRKMVNYLRLTGIVRNVVETSRGYTVARNAVELKRYLDQVVAQLNALEAVKQALENHSDLRGSQKSCQF